MIFKSLVPSVTLDNLYEYLDDIIDYYDQFKVFTSPFELMYPDPPVLNRVDRIYDATIEDDETTGDSLYNVSFRFIDANGVMYWAYAHMRINYGFNIDVEFYRGTMFVTKDPKIFFMTTMPSIDQTEETQCVHYQVPGKTMKRNALGSLTPGYQTTTRRSSVSSGTSMRTRRRGAAHATSSSASKDAQN